MTKHLRFLIVLLMTLVWSAGWAQKVTLDFSKSSNPWKLPASNSKEEKSYSYNGYTISFKFGTSGKGYCHQNYQNGAFLQMGKTGMTLVLPAFDFEVSKIEVVGHSSGNTTTTQNIFVDDLAICDETTGTKGTNTYIIPDTYQTKGTVYKLKVTNEYITRITSIKIYEKETTSTKTPTTIYLGDYANKSFSFTNGKSDDTFTTPTATVTPAAATGAVKYTSSDNDIVTVADNGQLSFTNKKFGSATISAQFIATGDYANSNTVTYTVVNKEPQKTATEVTFGDKSQQTITLTDGDVTGVVFPKASEKNNIAGTVSYESSNTDVAVVDAEGNVTIKGAYGEATITATFTPTDAETYAVSTDSYKVKNERGVVAGTITFDKANGAFEELPSRDYDANGIGNFSFISDSKESFTFDCTRVLKSEGCIQLKKTARTEINKIVSPTFPIFTNGYKVNVIYSSKKGLKLSAGGKDIVGSTTDTNDNGGNKGLGANVSISVPANASFVMTSGSEVVYISKIEIIPNKIDETTAITLDENSESNTIEAKTGVNVTLKRTMVANEWNTICLPFDVPAEQATAVFGDNVKIAALDENSTGTTLSFNSVKAITASVPYLIKPSIASPADGYNFKGVTIKDDGKGKVVAPKPVMTESLFGLVGIYNKVDVNEDIKNTLFSGDCYAAFLGAGNKIYKAGTGMTKGFRAYFAILKSASASALRVVIDGTATSIKNIDSEVVESNAPVYNLQGQRVDGNNLTPGIYVKAGKKFVVK